MNETSNEVSALVDGRTLVVEIHRPHARNSLTRSVLAAVREAFEKAARDASIRCVVIGGGGGHFCAGADLRKNLTENPNLMNELDVYMDAFHDVIRAIARCPKPTLARIEGAAVGFGADMALACDLRVASSTGYIQEKFVQIGLMPDGGGTFWLPRLVGTARAMQMILLAERVDAPMLASLGIVVSVASTETVHAETMALARKLEKGAPLAYAEAKRALLASWGDFEEALRREREGQLRLLRSADVMEGIMAWAQKRDPDFQGQ